MQNTYTAVVKEDDGWWLGWIEEIPGVNCQEHTREELMKSLQITLKEALEFNRLEAREAARSNYSDTRIEEILEDYGLYQLMQETEDSESLSISEAKDYYRGLPN